MASERPYFSQNSSSTASLLTPPGGRRTDSPSASQSQFQQYQGNQNLGRSPSVQAAFSQTPKSVSDMESGMTHQSDSRYLAGGKHGSVVPSISDKFSLSPNPIDWGTKLSLEHPENDDELHNPDPRRDRSHDQGGSVFTLRGITNLGCVSILFLGLIALFGGYPVISHFTKHTQSTLGGFNLGGINETGQVPSMNGNFGLIDIDTPRNVYTKKDYKDGKNWQLIFSDEFNVDGRTFYPGDDPYWEAVDLHYWGTNDLEWYDPAAITTKDGALEITLSKKQTHDLDYQGGMMSSWNKFCFTGGMIEVSVVLPGANNIVGLWPAIWTMGNLGRAGYGASLEGMWPYTYDACDIGTVANQSINGLPVAATEDGDSAWDGILSFLPGQRLSRCTCPGESHPGPIHADGTYVGRAAPEIDIFEAQVTGEPLSGQVSQSAQWAPFNAKYEWFNTSDNLIINDPDVTFLNPYVGASGQQATSGVSETDQQAYELTGNQFSVYGFQYREGFDGAYITWISNDKQVWTINQAGLAADPRVEISERPIAQEPMYIIMNLGISNNFFTPDFDHLQFPAKMRIDYVRVYQDPDRINYGCNPDDFPTADYINTYIEAYTNPNHTTWRDDYGQPFPKNKFLGQC